MSDRRTDRVFKALADPRRRRMLDPLACATLTTGDLAEAFPKLSRFAVMKHLGILERAGLLVVTREGRNRWNRLNPVPLREAVRRWMGKHEETLADTLINIRNVVEATGLMFFYVFFQGVCHGQSIEGTSPLDPGFPTHPGNPDQRHAQKRPGRR